MLPGFLTREEIEQRAPDLDIEAALSVALTQAAGGGAGQNVRTELAPETMPGLVGIMAGFRSAIPSRFAAKVVCVMPFNPGKGLPAHQGISVLFDGSDGRTLLVADAGAITELRTAALTALATRTLRSSTARVHLVVGSGHQALPHLRALHRIDPEGKFRIWARRPEGADAIRSSAYRVGIETEVRSSLAGACEEADTITMITAAREPLLRSEWVRPGTHINAVGSSTPKGCEFGPDVVASASLFVDDEASALSLAGEFVRLPERPHVTALGHVLAGERPGRASDKQVTVFKSVGGGLQDLALLDILFSANASHSE